MHQPCRPAPPGQLGPDSAGPSQMNPAPPWPPGSASSLPRPSTARAIAEFRARRAADHKPHQRAAPRSNRRARQPAQHNPVMPATARPDPLPRRARARRTRARQHACSPASPRPAQPQHVTTKTCRNVNVESCRLMCKQRGR
jgi:hypothetical protein